MKRVTIDDVAKHAKVSKSTVSQYLNKRYEYMGKQTRKRIEEAIALLDYHPNIVARSLKQKTTKTIGVIVANILHTFSTQVIRAIEDVCHESDFHLIVCNADDRPKKERQYIEMLQAKQVDGLIIFPTGGNIDLYSEMKRHQFPVVFVDRIVDSIQIPSVMLDNEKAAELAVQHFVEKGYERIGMLTNVVNDVTPRKERLAGFKKALRNNGICVNDSYIKSIEISQIQHGLKDILAVKPTVQAVLAGNDLTLIEILKYVKENKIRIPEDLAIIGIDDVPFASFYEPALTIVAQPAFEIGTKAAELLLNMIQNEIQDNSERYIYRLPPRLIERDSC